MKYKLLLIGKDATTINNFFLHMDNSFECLSSSLAFPDLTGHIKYFEPNAVVFCMNGENRDQISTITSLYFYLQKTTIPLILYANPEDFDLFKKIHTSQIDLHLERPMHIKVLEDHLTSFLNKQVRVNQKNSEANKSDTQALPGSSFSFSSYEDSFGSSFKFSSYEDSFGSGNSSSPKEDLDYDTRQIMKELKSELPMSGFNAGSALGEYDNDKKRIMIIDDSPAMLKAIKEHLKQDYEVATAISGKIGLKYLQNKTVDLILLDYEMPEMDGPTVMQMLQDNPKTSHIPVIFLTGIKETSKIQKALSFKPQGYLLKPVEREKLLTKIKEALD